MRRKAENVDLVIGYGNTLCSDDAVGRLTAEAIAEWQLPGVRALSVHQLTPELAADIAAAQRVIFVDARVAASAEDRSVSCLSLQSSESDLTPGGMTHHVDPRGLLALSAALYGATPTATLLTIPGVNFEIDIDGFGVERLSETARVGMEGALEYLRVLLA